MSRDQHNFAALLEGHCPWCGSRLTPVEPRAQDLRLEATCQTHGLWAVEKDADQWHNVTVLGLVHGFEWRSS